MMIKIDVKGDVVDNDTGQFFDYWGMQYVSPQVVKESLDKAQGDEVELDIASYGGDVFAASEIYTMINQYSGNVTGVIQGMAASAATIIAEACDHLIISPAGQMMIHKASTVGVGNSDDFTHTAGVLTTTDRTIASIYQSKTGKSEDEILNLMKQETYLTAQDAVKQGFADEIMKINDKVPQVVNGLHEIPSKDAVKKFKNLIQSQKGIDSNSKQFENDALFNEKLAMLKGENNGNTN